MSLIQPNANGIDEKMLWRHRRRGIEGAHLGCIKSCVFIQTKGSIQSIKKIQFLFIKSRIDRPNQQFQSVTLIMNHQSWQILNSCCMIHVLFHHGLVIFPCKDKNRSVVYKSIKTARTWLWRHYRSPNSEIHVLIVSLRMWIFELADR